MVGSPLEVYLEEGVVTVTKTFGKLPFASLLRAGLKIIKPFDGNGPLEKALKEKIINPYKKTTGIGTYFSGINKLTGSGIEQGVTFLNPTHVGTNIDYEGIQVTTCYKSGGCGYAQRLENSPINFAGANTSSEAGMCLIKLNY